MNDYFISFITPVFNEEKNISNMLLHLNDVLAKNPHWNYECILIEDGSSDNTRKILLEEAKKILHTSVILHDKNQGYTASLKEGIAAARGRYVMYIGADEEFDCTELPDFVNPLLEGTADVVLGVRWQRNAYGLFRFFLSVIYIFLLNYLFKIRINDYNWSQAWSRELLDRIELQSKSLFILPEIIIKAHDLKYRIKEVPSNHRGRYWGKSSLTYKIMGLALWEATKFRIHRQSLRYNPSAHSAPASPNYQTSSKSL